MGIDDELKRKLMFYKFIFTIVYGVMTGLKEILTKTIILLYLPSIDSRVTDVSKPKVRNFSADLFNDRDGLQIAVKAFLNLIHESIINSDSIQYAYDI